MSTNDIIDWSVLELPGVMQAAENAANAVARQYQGVVERDDLLQEAYIIVATEFVRTREYVEAEALGLLFWRLKQRLINVANGLAQHSNRIVRGALENMQ